MYYNLKLSYDPKIIGVRNGIYQVELIEKMYHKDYFKLFKAYFQSSEIVSIYKPPAFDVHFYFKKFKLTKDTDFMSFSPFLNNCHFLISVNIIDILRQFNIQSYELFPTSIIGPTQTEMNNSYKMFFSPIQDWRVIDFNNTVFSSGGYGNYPIKHHKFSDYEEYKKFNTITKVETIGLNQQFDSSLDLFYTRLGGVFISKRFKDALEDIKVSGVDFHKSVEVNIELDNTK